MLLKLTHLGRVGRTGATGRALAARPPGSVPLHVPRCDLALGRTPGVPPVAFMRCADKDTGSNFPGDEETPAQRGLRVLGVRDRKDRLTVL